MKRGYGRCTRCGCYCHATYDDGKQFFEAPSGRQHAHQVTPPQWVSDCHNAEAQVWEEER